MQQIIELNQQTNTQNNFFPKHTMGTSYDDRDDLISKSFAHTKIEGESRADES